MQVFSKNVSCSKTSLQRHSESSQHKKTCAGARNQIDLSVSVRKQEERSIYKETTTTQIAAFIAEHNLPVSLSDSLLSLIKARCPKDSKECVGLQEIQMGATKCTNVIRQGTGLYFAKELVETLSIKKFSIIPD